MSDLAIRVENLSKLYHIGQHGGGASVVSSQQPLMPGLDGVMSDSRSFTLFADSKVFLRDSTNPIRSWSVVSGQWSAVPSVP